VLKVAAAVKRLLDVPKLFIYTADDQGNVEFTDSNTGKQPVRFYRAVEQ
jgi:hypothetical protein